MPDELERACDEAAADGRRVALLYVIPVRTLIAIIGTLIAIIGTLIAIIGTLIAIIGTLIAIIGAVRRTGTTRALLRVTWQQRMAAARMKRGVRRATEPGGAAWLGASPAGQRGSGRARRDAQRVGTVGTDSMGSRVRPICIDIHT